MSSYEIVSLLVTLAAFFSFLSCRFLRLPPTIGITLVALLISLLIIAAGESAEGFREAATKFVQHLDFNRLLIHGMLGFLLFAGSLHLDIADLASEWDAIALLSVVGTLASTAMVGVGSWLLFGLLGLHPPLLHCLIFGALISPTDPIAVLGIMKRVKAPRRLQAQMNGESLFNDGISVVIFLVLLQSASGAAAFSPLRITSLFLQEALGGAAFGLAIGLLTYRLIKEVDNYQTEILLTLAVATGGYALADALHVSAPIAIVVAGLFIGNRGRSFAMSETTQQHLYLFWDLVDETLNAILFMLIGLEILALPRQSRLLPAGALCIVLLLLARWLTVGGLVHLLRLRRSFDPGVVRVLTWGGLRGGLSVAMALSLPDWPHKGLFVDVTYIIVVFSICVQGLTIGRLIRKSMAAPRAAVQAPVTLAI